MDDEYDPDEIPNHHLPRMPDYQNPNMSGNLNHHPNPNMADLNNPSGHHNYPLNPKMSDLQNPSGHHHPPKMTDLESPSGRPLRFPSTLPPPVGKNKHRLPQHSQPPPQPYGRRRQSSKAGAFAAIATLALLLALTALILYLIYRPKTPHFTVVAASIYLLNSTTAPPPTASFLAATIQFTVVTRNPHRHTSLYYDHLTAQVFYRDQPITPPSDLPPLHHTHRTTVVFSPVLGGGEPVPVAPGVVEGLAADEIYGVMGLRLTLMGRVRYKAGIINTVHYGVYVGCDVLIGVKKAVVGPVPLLANHDCKVDM